VPPPVVIYQDNTEEVDHYIQQKDSLNNVIDVLKEKTDSLYSTVEKVKKEHIATLAKLKEMQPTGQVAYFGERTGDTTLVMREKDSLTLVPLHCIQEANRLIVSGDNALVELDIQRKANSSLQATVEALEVSIEQSEEYIAFMKEENNRERQRNAELAKDLAKKTQTNKTLWGITLTTGTVTVLTILGLVLL
jgi:predicted ribosome quality control (RQC) complex YloA/Tae2 family protein